MLSLYTANVIGPSGQRISSQIPDKFEMNLMGLSGYQGKLIYEKTQVENLVALSL
jgi:hypothetical protein